MKRAVWILCLCLIGAVIAAGRGPSSDVVVMLYPGQSIDKLTRDTETTLVRSITKRDAYLIRTGGDITQLLDQLRRHPAVASAEINATIRLTDTAAPATFANLGGESAYLLDWRSKSDFFGVEVPRAYIRQPALRIIEADAARSISTGRGARVAIIDTGVDPYHPALRPWLDSGADLVRGVSASEWDGLAGESAYLLDGESAYLLDGESAYLLDGESAYLLDGESAYLLDQRFRFSAEQSFGSRLSTALNRPSLPPAFGHGTLVAGAVHAVAPEARIIPIKAFDAYGRTDVFRLIDAVYSAVDLGADVINMSFSTPQYSAALRKAIASAQAVGVVAVASVGNDGNSSRRVYPAGFSNVYGVAASDFSDRLAAYSNYGKAVSIVAPGSFVISTAPGGHYAAVWGTSFSAPLVSGGVALLAGVQAAGHADGPQIVVNADPIDALNPLFAGQLGKGRLNLHRALMLR